MPYLDDIWYVGRARVEGTHAEFWVWHMLVPGIAGFKNVKQCSVTIKLGQKNRWYKFKMMVTFMEVKGHQRSNVVN